MANQTSSRLTIIRPDDWHLHVRDGALLKAVLPYSAKIFGRAIIMPNIRPPVTNTEKAHAYREEIIAATPSSCKFTPLMTLYLTDTTQADDLAKGHAKGILTAAKLYPANATTHSEHGVTNLRSLSRVFERMQEIGMPLLIHGEVTDPEVDIFDREAVFIEQILMPLRKNMPGLKIVLEHITTKEAAAYVASEGEKGLLAATVTAHHLVFNRNALFQGGIRPHFYCLPIAKREIHRQALIKAATSGSKMFFLGTDSAPHVRAAKENDCGCAGIFSAPHAIETYAQVFDEAGALDQFEAFASRNGPAFYGLPVNKETVELERVSQPRGEIKAILTEKEEEIVVFTPQASSHWRMAGG